MTNFDKAIAAYLADPTEARLNELDQTLLGEEFAVPIGDEVTEIAPGKFNVPVVCINTSHGNGAVPAFTSVNHLLAWKPSGTLHTVLRGEALIRLAQGMPEVSEILINCADSPRGAIPRSDFARLLALRAT